MVEDWCVYRKAKRTREKYPIDQLFYFSNKKIFNFHGLLSIEMLKQNVSASTWYVLNLLNKPISDVTILDSTIWKLLTFGQNARATYFDIVLTNIFSLNHNTFTNKSTNFGKTSSAGSWQNIASWQNIWNCWMKPSESKIDSKFVSMGPYWLLWKFEI